MVGKVDDAIMADKIGMILDDSLANSQGPWTVDHGPGLLRLFVSQIWIAVRGCEWILGVGSCALDLGSGIVGGGRGSNPFNNHFCTLSPRLLHPQRCWSNIYQR